MRKRSSAFLSVKSAANVRLKKTFFVHLVQNFDAIICKCNMS